MSFDTTHTIKIPKKNNLGINSLKTSIMNISEQLNETLYHIRNTNKLLNIVGNYNFYIIEETFNHWGFYDASHFCEILSKDINSHIYLKSTDETDKKYSAVFYDGITLTNNVEDNKIKFLQFEILIKGKGMKIQKYIIENNDRETAINTAMGIFKYHNSNIIEKTWSKII